MLRVQFIFLTIFFCSTALSAQVDTTRLEILSDTLCSDNAMLTARVMGTSYSWNTGQEQESIAIFASGTYVVFIRDADGNITVDERNITLLTVPNPILPVTVEPGPFCVGDSVTYTVNLSGYDEIQWNNGLGVVYPPFGPDGTQARIPFIPGTTITYIAAYTRCNESLTVLPPITLSANDLATDFSGTVTPQLLSDVCPGDSITFSFSGEGFSSFSWEDGTTNLERTIIADEMTDYSAEVLTVCGEIITYLIDVSYRSDCFPCEVIMPELITPNGDGTNDLLRAFSSPSCDFAAYNLRVFNRWGQKVFSTTSAGQGWDGTIKGTPQNQDNYLYLLEFQLVGELPETRSGNFVLIR